MNLEDKMVYEVVVNIEDQYSIWPKGRNIPSGWKAIGKSGLKNDCLSYINDVWKDMRPKILKISEQSK